MNEKLPVITALLAILVVTSFASADPFSNQISPNDPATTDSLTITKGLNPEWVIGFADGRVLFLGYQNNQPVYYQLTTAPTKLNSLPADSILIVHYRQRNFGQEAKIANQVFPQWVIYYPGIAILLEHQAKASWFRINQTRPESYGFQTEIQTVIHYPKPPTKKVNFRSKEKAVIWTPPTKTTE
ncbi:MAG: hypothetical protein NTV81_00345 [Candidatus Komeilibacteria bacterium]|nr:hypothetical protein [Candidatus Komeilibacteria bacterium]